MRAIQSLAVMLGLGVCVACAGAQEQTVHVALTKKVFWLEAARDVLPQAQLMAEKVGESIHRTIVAQEAKDTSLGSLADALASGDYDFVICDGLDFVMLQQEFQKRARLDGTRARTLRAIAAVSMPPEAEGAAAGTTCALLVTRKDPALRAVADVRGKRLVYAPNAETDCSMLYLAGLLRKEGAKSKEEFFGSVKRLSCEDACLIALQRGSADVICISEEKLLAKQMVAGPFTNNLWRLASSKPYAGFVCFHVEGLVAPKLVNDFRTELMEMHKTAEGAKLLEMFNVRSFVPVSAQSFTPIEEMVRAAEPEPAALAR